MWEIEFEIGDDVIPCANTHTHTRIHNPDSCSGQRIFFIVIVHLRNERVSILTESWCKLTWTVGENYIVQHCGWGTFVCVTKRMLKLPNLILSLRAPGYKAKYSHSTSPISHTDLWSLENVTEGQKCTEIKERIKENTQIKSGIRSWSKSHIANPSPNVLFQNQLKLVCSFQRYTMFSSPSVSLFSVSMVTKGWSTSRTSAWLSPTPVPPAVQDSWTWLRWPTSGKTRSDVISHYVINSHHRLIIIFFMLFYPNIISSMKQNMKSEAEYFAYNYGFWMVDDIL